MLRSQSTSSGAMRRKQQREGGYMVLIVVVCVGLLMSGLATGMLINSYRAQSIVREMSVQTEATKADLQYRRDLATALFNSVVANVLAGGSTVAISSTAAPAYGGTVVTSGDSSLDERATWTKSGTYSGSGSLGVTAWTTANGGGYTLQTPTGTAYRMLGGSSFLAKKFIISASRSIQGLDNLRTTGTTPTDAETMKVVVYEIPKQSLAAYGDALQIPANMAVAGSVFAKKLNLGAGSEIGSAAVTDDLFWGAGSQVGSISLSGSKQAEAGGSELAKNLEAGVYSGGVPVGPEEISVFRGNEFGMVLDLGDQGMNSEGIRNGLLPSTSPTTWEGYVKPYYQCSTRIDATLDAAKTTATVVIKVVSTSSLASRIAAGTQSGSAVVLNVNGAEVNGLSLVQTGTGRINLRVDPVLLSARVGVSSARAISVDLRDAIGSRLGNIGVSLKGMKDLSTLGGFSLVTPNVLTLQGRVNTTNAVPLSLFATRTIFGTKANAQVEFNGQMTVEGTGTGYASLGEMTNDYGTVGAGQKVVNLSNVTAVVKVPPVTEKIWVITAE